MALMAASLSAQTFTAAEGIRRAPAPADNSLVWMTYCDANSNRISGVGTGSTEPMLHAVTHFKLNTLEENKGKSISVVSIYMNTTVTDATVFVVKGNDINKAETLAEVKVPQLAAGWNTIKLDTPVSIDATERLGVGYAAIDNATYPVAFDGKTAITGTSYLSVQNQAYEAGQATWGNLMIRALVDGDPTSMAYNLSIDKLNLPPFVPEKEPITVTMDLANTSFETINDFTCELTVNGNKEVKEVKLDRPIAANSAYTYTLTLDPVAETTKFEFNITKVNGHDNAAAAVITRTVEPYNASETFERNILIEKFTGQNCGYCPGGETSILNAIKGHEDHVVRIDHHCGYMDDIFTISESKSIASAVRVSGAPSCMIDRRVQEERKGTQADGVVFHPGYLNEEIVANAIAAPAHVSVKVEPTYDAATRTATIKVSGKTYKDMAGTRITACLTQSGVQAYQSSADASWRHNDFPVAFMTAYNGDEITWNSDGTFSVTYTYTIPEKNTTGKVTIVPDDMGVVAFVSRWGTNNYDVMNAAAAKLVAGDTGVEATEAETARFAFAAGQFTLGGNAEGVEVYGISGARLANEGLAAGIYIVKANVAGTPVVRKMAVR